MEQTISISKTEKKANLYKVLSILFVQPTSEMDFYLTHLQDSVEYLYPELKEKVDKLRNEFQKHKEDLTNLKVEHAKLFIGPFDVLAPPYSSIYLEQGRSVIGESTLFAKDMYEKAGISMSQESKEIPDHISIELEFLYYLYF